MTLMCPTFEALVVNLHCLLYPILYHRRMHPLMCGLRRCVEDPPGVVGAMRVKTRVIEKTAEEKQHFRATL